MRVWTVSKEVPNYFAPISPIYLCLRNFVAASLADHKAEMKELTEETSPKKERKSQEAREAPAVEPTRSITPSATQWLQIKAQ